MWLSFWGLDSALFNFKLSLLNVKKKKLVTVTSSKNKNTKRVTGATFVTVSPKVKGSPVKRESFLIRQSRYGSKLDLSSTKSRSNAAIALTGGLSLSPSKLGFFLNYCTNKAFTLKYRLKL